MLTCRPASCFPSTSQPLLKVIRQLRLCLQKSSENLHSRCSSSYSVSSKNLKFLQSRMHSQSIASSENIFQDENERFQGKNVRTVCKKMFPTENKLLLLCNHGRNLKSNELLKGPVIDTNIDEAGGKIKNVEVQNNVNFYRFPEGCIMERSQSETESILNVAQNSTQTKTCSGYVSRNSQNYKDAEISILQLYNNPQNNVKDRFWHHQTFHNKVCISRWKLLYNCKGNPNPKMLCSQKIRQCGLSNCVRNYSTQTNLKQDKPWKILFFGTDNFAVEILKNLNENRLQSTGSVVESLDVVSNPGKTAVRQYADSSDLRVLTWPVRSLTTHYDVGVLASFGHLIPGRLINSFPHGILNVHPSLLPRWRGSAPIIHTVLSGDALTGISIMKLRPKRFDIGSLLIQKEVVVPPRITSCQLSDLLAKHGAQVLIECLSNLSVYEKSEYEQSTTGVTLAHKLKPSVAQISWQQQTCDEIDRLYRAVGEMMPLRSHWKDLPVKLLDKVDPALVHDLTNCPVTRLSENSPPGTPVFSKDRQLLLIKCKVGFVGFRTVIIKKKMSAQAFYNGYLSKPQNKDVIFT